MEIPNYGVHTTSPGSICPTAEYPKEFTIKVVDNGFIVTVGCKTVVFKTQQELIDAMKFYLADPAKAEKKYVGGKA